MEQLGDALLPQIVGYTDADREKMCAARDEFARLRVHSEELFERGTAATTSKTLSFEDLAAGTRTRLVCR